MADRGPHINLDMPVDEALAELGILIDISTIEGLEELVNFVKNNIGIITSEPGFHPWHLEALTSLVNKYNDEYPYEDQERYHSLWEQLAYVASKVLHTSHPDIIPNPPGGPRNSVYDNLPDAVTKLGITLQNDVLTVTGLRELVSHISANVSEYSLPELMFLLHVIGEAPIKFKEEESAEEYYYLYDVLTGTIAKKYREG